MSLATSLTYSYDLRRMIAVVDTEEFWTGVQVTDYFHNFDVRFSRWRLFPMAAFREERLFTEAEEGNEMKRASRQNQLRNPRCERSCFRALNKREIGLMASPVRVRVTYVPCPMSTSANSGLRWD